ncbi:MAG: aminotransferase class IV [Candidatus Omnitrophica bacterium]|nr:aminotransferase class IV [Candidatus Omnitrophota bacterium]
MQVTDYNLQNNILLDFGYNVFESMRVYEGKIFCLKEHFKRLEESAKTLKIDLPYSKKELKTIVLREFKKSGIENAYVRISIDSKHKLNVIVKPAKSYSPKLYQKGVEIVTITMKKDLVSALFSEAKTGNFLNGILARMEAGNFFEAILINREGFITEGTVSNIFMIKNNVLFTPPIFLGILPGITRKVVMELAKDVGLGLKEAIFTRHELYNADEVFLTNTSIEIMPVRYVDKRKIGSGLFRNTNNLRKRFIERRRND